MKGSGERLNICKNVAFILYDIFNSEIMQLLKVRTLIGANFLFMFSKEREKTVLIKFSFFSRKLEKKICTN